MAVVNVRKTELKKIGFPDFQGWANNPNHVYIGRNMSFYVPGTTASKWQNPFSMKKYSREQCLVLYENYIRSTPELLDSLPELKGKILGCWCHPDSCHGDVLLRLIEEFA